MQNSANELERPSAKILRWPGVEAIMQSYYLHAAGKYTLLFTFRFRFLSFIRM